LTSSSELSSWRWRIPRLSGQPLRHGDVGMEIGRHLGLPGDEPTADRVGVHLSHAEGSFARQALARLRRRESPSYP